mgnify:CR=1 FL=1
MFGFITGKIKAWALAAAAVALPLLYIIGRKDGKKASQVQQLKDAVENNDDRADFYRQMAEYPDDYPRLTRHDLVERLRSSGL